MEYIIGRRASGKTTKMIKKVEKENAFLLVCNEVERDRLVKLYPHLKDKIFSWHSLPECFIGKKREKVFIDNADYFIAKFINNFELGGLSLNKD